MEQFDHWPKVRGKVRPLLPPNPEKEEGKKAVKLGRFPSWLHRKLPKGGTLAKTGSILSQKRLHTVCEEAKCPNLLECWSRKTATFLILGKSCTRSCGFCDIDFASHPSPPDPDEPARVVEAVRSLGLKHVVITQVARDDLSDGGAAHLVRVMTALRQAGLGTTIEVLTSDFQGNEEAWKTVSSAQPDIFNYNIETVKRLTPRVRHKATYERTLTFLRYLSGKKKKRFLIKSGLMVGFGETKEEVHKALCDLKDAGCDIVTIGQYLQPNRHKLLVKEFVTPSQFDQYRDYGLSIGLRYVYAGPFVRSSYNADQVFKELSGC